MLLFNTMQPHSRTEQRTRTHKPGNREQRCYCQYHFEVLLEEHVLYSWDRNVGNNPEAAPSFKKLGPKPPAAHGGDQGPGDEGTGHIDLAPCWICRA